MKIIHRKKKTGQAMIVLPIAMSIMLAQGTSSYDVLPQLMGLTTYYIVQSIVIVYTLILGIFFLSKPFASLEENEVKIFHSPFKTSTIPVHEILDVEMINYDQFMVIMKTGDSIKINTKPIEDDSQRQELKSFLKNDL